MKVLLTGDCGLLGRRLGAAIHARRLDVTSCDLVMGRDALDPAVHCAAIAYRGRRGA